MGPAWNHNSALVYDKLCDSLDSTLYCIYCIIINIVALLNLSETLYRDLVYVLLYYIIYSYIYINDTLLDWFFWCRWKFLVYFMLYLILLSKLFKPIEYILYIHHYFFSLVASSQRFSRVRLILDCEVDSTSI